MTTLQEFQLPLERRWGLLLAFVFAMLATVIIVTVIGAARLFTVFVPSVAQPQLSPDATEKPVPPLTVSAGPARGIYTTAESPYLPAEAERAATAALGSKPSDRIDPTTAALRRERYQQYLRDQGLVPVDRVMLRNQVERDARGNVVRQKRELILPRD